MEHWRSDYVKHWGGRGNRISEFKARMAQGDPVSGEREGERGREMGRGREQERERGGERENLIMYSTSQ